MSKERVPEYSVDCDDETPCEQTLCETKRRRLLGALAAGGSVSLAGCTGILSSPEASEIRGKEDRYNLNFLREGEQIEVRGSETILRGAEDKGLEIPYACRAGFCGVCLSEAQSEDATAVVDMSRNTFEPLNQEAVEAGYVLPCTSQPRADIDIRTEVAQGELDEFQDDDDDDDDDNDEPNGARHLITYTNEQWRISVGEDENLLEAGEDVGLDLPYACRVGSCGQCLSKTDDGDARDLVEHETIDYGPLDEDALEEGYLLTCTAHPRADFAFESNRAGEL